MLNMNALSMLRVIKFMDLVTDRTSKNIKKTRKQTDNQVCRLPGY